MMSNLNPKSCLTTKRQTTQREQLYIIQESLSVNLHTCIYYYRFSSEDFVKLHICEAITTHRHEQGGGWM